MQNCRENFDLNRVTTPHEIVLGSIERCQADSAYDVICANILKGPILDMLDSMVALLAEKGTLILSGLLEEDLDEVTSALARHKLAPAEIVADNEWRTLVIGRE